MTTLASRAVESDVSEPPARTIGLSGRLALVTIAIVLIAQIMVFVPALSSFRRAWLNDRLVGAKMTAVVLAAYPDPSHLPDGLDSGLKAGIPSPVIALRGNGTRWLELRGRRPHELGNTFDLQNDSWWHPVRDLFLSLTPDGERPSLVVGRGVPGVPAVSRVEMIFDPAQLTAAMVTFARSFLIVSLVVSGITAAFMFFVLHRFLVRPVHRLTTNITAFAAAPEDGTVIRPSGRTDEIGLAEQALARMETTLSGELRQRRRLAELGLAVSKINHELRNMLTTAQLLGDRLGETDDPAVQRIAPRLIRTLNRAITFCGATLAYGRAVEHAPERQAVDLHVIIQDLADLTRLSPETPVCLVVDVPDRFVVEVDPDHLTRALSNLVRNAVQALAHARLPDAQITISARRDGAVACVCVADNGPGLPPRMRADMFAPFQTSLAPDGAGLGLHIAHDLVRLQGGTLALEPSERGTRFVIRLPQQVAV